VLKTRLWRKKTDNSKRSGLKIASSINKKGPFNSSELKLPIYKEKKQLNQIRKIIFKK